MRNTSASATLTVNNPLVIITQPASTVVGLGMVVNLNVFHGGGAPFGYQWQKNGGNLANGGNVSGANPPN